MIYFQAQAQCDAKGCDKITEIEMKVNGDGTIEVNDSNGCRIITNKGKMPTLVYCSKCSEDLK